MYGRAFAFASSERKEADAKEGVYRAALCRNILQTILDQLPRDRIEKFDLERLATAWQNMTTLGPMGSRVQQPSPAPSSIASRTAQQTEHRPRTSTTQQPSLQQSILPRPTDSATQHISGRMLGSHSLVSPSTSTNGLSALASAKTSAPQPNPSANSSALPPVAPAALRNPPLSHPPFSNSSPARAPEPSTSRLPVQASAPVAGSSRTNIPSFPAASTSSNSPAQTSATPARTAGNLVQANTADSPDFYNIDEAKAYRSVLNAPVPSTATERIRWMCEVHLSRCKSPSVYKPYVSFQWEGSIAKLSVARNTLGTYSILLSDDEVYLMEDPLGREWIKEELARQAIDKGILSRAVKVKMPKATVKPDLVELIRRFTHTILAQNTKPAPPPPANNRNTESTFNTLSYGRPPLQIAATAVPAGVLQNSDMPSLSTTFRQMMGTPVSLDKSQSTSVVGTGAMQNDLPRATATDAKPSIPPAGSTLPPKTTLTTANAQTATSKPELPAVTAKSGPSLSGEHGPVNTVFSPSFIQHNAENSQQIGPAKEALPSGHVESGLPMPIQASSSRDPRLQARLALSARVDPIETPVIAPTPQPIATKAPTEKQQSPPLQGPVGQISPFVGPIQPTGASLPPAMLPPKDVSPTPQQRKSSAAVSGSMSSQMAMPEKDLASTITPIQSAERPNPANTPSLSERLASKTGQSPPGGAREEQSLLARLQSTATDAPNSSEGVVETQEKSSVASTETEQVGGISLLDRLVNMKAELRKRIGVQRSASKQSISEDDNNTVQGSGMRVDGPALEPLETPISQKPTSGIDGDPSPIAMMGPQVDDKDTQVAEQPPFGAQSEQSGPVIEAPAPSKEASLPTGMAVASLDNSVDPTEDVSQSAVPAQATPHAGPPETQENPQGSVAVSTPDLTTAQGVNDSSGVGPSQSGPAPSAAGLDDADAPFKAAVTVAAPLASAVRPEGVPNESDHPIAPSPSIDSIAQQGVLSAPLSRTGSIGSSHSRPEAELSNDNEGRTKRRWDESSETTMTQYDGPEDSLSKRRRRISSPPLANGLSKDISRRSSGGVYSGSVTVNKYILMRDYFACRRSMC